MFRYLDPIPTRGTDSAPTSQRLHQKFPHSYMSVEYGHIITAAASLIQTGARTESASWTIPLVFSHSSIFIKNPTNVFNYESYVEPMAYLSWGFVVVFLLFTPPFLYFGFSYNPNPEDKMSLAESFAAVFMTITMMGAPFHPKNISARIVLLRYINIIEIFLKTFTNL